MLPQRQARIEKTGNCDTIFFHSTVYMVEHIGAKFDREYANKYDTLSGDIGAYEVWAKTLADRLREHKPDAKAVLEIGSGTGNSAVVLLETVPSIENLYGLEVSDFILLARAKQKGATDELFFPNEAPAYSRQVAQRMQAHKDKFHLIKAAGEQLPIKDGSMDVVFMNQVFHWLEPDKALEEIRRVLKSDGIIVFDESEAQFDFGDTAEGEKIKREQAVDHPFVKSFQENFDHELLRRGTVVEKKPFRYLFTLDSLSTLLEKHGFELVPDANGSAYTTATVRYSLVQAMSFAENGARMRIMRQMPDLLKTPGVADEIVSATMENTKQEWGGSPNNADGKKYGPSQAAFVARKKPATIS